MTMLKRDYFSNQFIIWKIVAFLGCSVLAVICLLIYIGIRPIYRAVVLAKISHSQTKDIPDSDQLAKVSRLLAYTHAQVRPEMLPNEGQESFHYLEYGFAWCDSQSEVLMNLLYYQGVDARTVPLFKSDGTSNHTFMEWNNKDRWLVLDPLANYNLPVTAKELIGLSKEELVEAYGIDPTAYQYFADNHFEAIAYTYQRDTYSTGGPVRQGKTFAGSILDTLSLGLVKYFPHTGPRLLQRIYIARYLSGDTVESKYLVARSFDLLGYADEANKLYQEIFGLTDVADWPEERTFSINRPMLELRLQLLN